MNKAKEVAEVCGKAIIKQLTRYLPLGDLAVGIYEEFQSKQIERKVHRFEEFCKAVSEAITNLEEKINSDYINHQDFLDIFEKATDHIVSERSASKREFFKNILVNSIISPSCSYDKTERFFRLLDLLLEEDLLVLAVLANPREFIEKNGIIIEPPQSRNVWVPVTALGVLSEVLGKKNSELEDSLSVLIANGLVLEDIKERSLNIMSQFDRVLNNLLTVRGIEFVKYWSSVGQI